MFYIVTKYTTLHHVEPQANTVIIEEVQEQQAKGDPVNQEQVLQATVHPHQVLPFLIYHYMDVGLVVH